MSRTNFVIRVASDLFYDAEDCRTVADPAFATAWNRRSDAEHVADGLRARFPSAIVIPDPA